MRSFHHDIANEEKFKCWGLQLLHKLEKIGWVHNYEHIIGVFSGLLISMISLVKLGTYLIPYHCVYDNEN